MGYPDIMQLRAEEAARADGAASKLGIAEMSKAAYENSRQKGFHDGEFNVAEKLALIHSEVSEALEANREGLMETMYEHKMHDGGTLVLGVPRTTDGLLGKPVGFVSELADILIRVGDLAGRLGRAEELEKVIIEKMAYNRTRPRKHGKAY